ncbi:galectin-9-like [Ovis aries]|uniref:galectin-9-like n=1 Tax=Ovis aries TaxID=9940 RepID=UPI001C2E6585|nr:galectin-9-like [Ovis aries]
MRKMMPALLQSPPLLTVPYLASSATQITCLVPPVPFTGRIVGGLQDGHKVTIMGHVPSRGERRFSVNFQRGYNDREIDFHFNPRFEEGGYVVCNMKQLGNWGPEERKMQMPFQKGSPFEICFEVDSSVFKVTVNGSIFLDYAHRVPFDQVNAISIKGGVYVSRISSRYRNPYHVEDVHCMVLTQS